ncbi:hypothetical protein Tco_1022823 [Tanacetum coccineum]
MKSFRYSDFLLPRSYDVNFSTYLRLNDDFTLFMDYILFDEEFEDISSLDPESTPVIDESSLLVTPPPASKQLSLREVERFDLFFYLTQSGAETRVMEILSFGFHHMPSPRPAAHPPKEVMILFDREDLRACFQSSNHSVSGRSSYLYLENPQS